MWRFPEGLPSLIVGVLMLVDPRNDEIGSTLLLTLFLLVGGALRILLALQVRGLGNWIWPLISGVIEVLLGVMILSTIHQTSGGGIGLFVGIRMLFQGSSMLTLVLTPRGLGPTAPQSQ